MSDAGPAGLLFAATRPRRTAALILFNTTARYLETDDDPIGLALKDYDAVAQAAAEGWGVSPGEWAFRFVPSLRSDPRSAKWMPKLQRSIASPTALSDYAMATAEADARSLLSSIEVPTLVIHRADGGFTPLEHGRYLAEHIEGAELVEIGGADTYSYFENPDTTIEALEVFRTVAVTP